MARWIPSSFFVLAFLLLYAIGSSAGAFVASDIHQITSHDRILSHHHHDGAEAHYDLEDGGPSHVHLSDLSQPSGLPIASSGVGLPQAPSNSPNALVNPPKDVFLAPLRRPPKAPLMLA